MEFSFAGWSRLRWQVHLFWGIFCVRFLCICKTMRFPGIYKINFDCSRTICINFNYIIIIIGLVINAKLSHYNFIFHVSFTDEVAVWLQIHAAEASLCCLRSQVSVLQNSIPFLIAKLFRDFKNCVIFRNLT